MLTANPTVEQQSLYGANPGHRTATRDPSKVVLAMCSAGAKQCWSYVVLNLLGSLVQERCRISPICLILMHPSLPVLGILRLCINMCTDMCMDMCVDKAIHMRVDMRADMRVDMAIGTRF